MLQKINARDCTIKSVSKKEGRSFLDKNHSQWYANSIYQCGLYYNGELVQMMAFGTPRFNNNYKWEIIRECTKKGCQVRGGTSKLWKYFCEKNSPTGEDKVRPCICYSFPKDGKFTDHYIKYCGFKNIRRCRKVTKIYYEGILNGELKIIDQSILYRQGLKKMLGIEQPEGKTIEQTLLDLGFVRKTKQGMSPQIDIYYKFSVVYRIDDLTDGSFYIGLCEREKEWKDRNYLGTGKAWLNHIKKHPNKSKHKHRKNPEAHLYRRTVLKENFNTPKEARDYEVEKIREHFECIDGKWVKKNDKCWNIKVHTQSTLYIPPECPECGGKMGRHFATCSQAEPCPECGCVNGHKEDCSHNKIEGCPHCGRKTGPHKKGCPLAPKKPQYTCPECGSHNKGAHKKTCSKYKEPKGKCEYCGTPAGGKHKKDCPNRPPDKKCPECGYILSSNKHAPTCSHYKKPKEPEPCPICGGTRVHSKNCPKAPKCPECGGSKRTSQDRLL